LNGRSAAAPANPLLFARRQFDGGEFAFNKEINAGLVDPKIAARTADLGATVLPGSPADFGKLIAGETEKWGKVIKSAGIKPE
jgi:tripartite-type tricarboxylate transporter receptor subunit TctC